MAMFIVTILGTVSTATGFGLLFVLGMRALARQGYKHHERSRVVTSHPECTCYYDGDDGPYGLPHVVNCRSCEAFYRENGGWPSWCRYS